MVLHSRVRRRAQACARCRTRKVHCDALPSGCSLCTDAGVPCVALNTTTNEAMPRSVAQFLETKIAERERTRGQKHAPKVCSGDRAFTRPIVNKLLDGITPSFLGLSAAVPLARCVIAGTRLPSAREVLGGVSNASDSSVHEHSPKSVVTTGSNNNIPPRSPTTPLSSIPVHVADFLFDNYVTRVAPQYPIYYTPDLVAMHTSVFHRGGGAAQAAVSQPPGADLTYEMYTLNLIMAISLSTAARSKQARANSIACGLFETAMQQLPGVLTNDLRGLQALILLTQYTFLNPGVANFWLLTGFISQACIDLGLHQELPPGAAGVSPLERDMRRRIFWCAWEMEVAVCGALLRPITLLRRNVTTAFPSPLEDSAITDAGIDPAGRPTKFTSRFIWRYREVECDIVPVLFHGEPLPAEYADNLEAWMALQERAILDWKAEIHDSTARNTDPQAQSLWDEMQLYADIASDYILVTLFRPCSRLRDPPAANLLKAFAAAVGVADGSWQQANLEFGSSKYVFHACYHSFSAAIAFLQALQRIKPAIAAAYTWAQVEANMRTFARFFATVAERWPAASRCLEEYERLLAPVKKDFVDYLAQEAAARRLTEMSAAHSTSSLGGAGMAAASAADMDLDAAAFDLDEALKFGTFFNVAAPGLDDAAGGHYHPYVPMDWNEEFSFGVDKMAMPPRS